MAARGQLRIANMLFWTPLLFGVGWLSLIAYCGLM
jgi:hypothetical protein